MHPTLYPLPAYGAQVGGGDRRGGGAIAWGLSWWGRIVPIKVGTKMHVITKKDRGRDYLYLAWNEKFEGKWRKRSKYLGKSARAALKKLGELELDPAERDRLAESLDSDVWETPDHVISSVIAVMGAIDLDPATKGSNPCGATRFYTKDDDGLLQPWEGRVYLNPPYSAPAPFLLKLIKEYQAGNVTQAIALCKSGVLQNKSTGTAIHESLAAEGRWKGRLNFRHSKAKDKGRGSDFDVSLIYWGPERDRFEQVFEPYCFIK